MGRVSILRQRGQRRRIWERFEPRLRVGRLPWEEYKVAERFMRFGPEGGISMQSLEPDKGREYK